MTKITAKKKREARHLSIRSRVKGTKATPRLSIFRSNQHLYLQLIDDDNSKVLAAVSDLKLASKKSGIELATSLGIALAKAAKDKGVVKVVFDRGGYKYHGKVKAIAEAAREEGLIF